MLNKYINPDGGTGPT
jgi:hypothetical protein